MRYSLFLVQVTVLLLTALPTFGGNLYAPYALESTQVLPGGVRNPRFLTVHMLMSEKFGANSQIEPLGDRLNKPVSWNDVLESQGDDEVQKKLIRSVLNDKNIDINGSPGGATGTVNARASINAPVLALGVSSRFTLGLVVPVYYIDVSVDKGFVKTNDGQRFVDALCESSPATCNDAAQKLNKAIDQKLSRLGYAPLESHTVSNVGDLILMGKYLLVEGENNNIAAKLSLTFPTGTKPNVDRALDITTGDGRYKIGTALVYDRNFFANTKWNIYGAYTAHLPFSLERRLPVSASDSLSDKKAWVTKKWQNTVSVGTGLSYPLPSWGLTLSTGYSFQHQSGASFGGEDPDPENQNRIKLLDDLEPSQSLHSIVASIGFSTVDWYKRREFFLPFQANVVYSFPISGRNAPDNEVVAGEIVLFF